MCTCENTCACALCPRVRAHAHVHSCVSMLFILVWAHAFACMCACGLWSPLSTGHVSSRAPEHPPPVLVPLPQPPAPRGRDTVTPESPRLWGAACQEMGSETKQTLPTGSQQLSCLSALTRAMGTGAAGRGVCSVGLTRSRGVPLLVTLWRPLVCLCGCLQPRLLPALASRASMAWRPARGGLVLGVCFGALVPGFRRHWSPPVTRV